MIIARSPVFNHLSSSVHGLTTIRALGAENILTKEFDNHQDLHSSAWFIFFSGSKAFGMYIELLCMVFIGVLVYSFIFFKQLTMAGDVGFLVTECILLTGILQVYFTNWYVLLTGILLTTNFLLCYCSGA